MLSTDSHRPRGAPPRAPARCRVSLPPPLANHASAHFAARIRQVKNTGFDLVLPGQENAANPPLEPRKSGRSRKTPQPELLPQRSTRRTPAPEELLQQRSTRRTPAPELPPQRSSRRTPATGARKKRGRATQDAIQERGETADAVGPIAGQDDGESNATKRGRLNQAAKSSKGAKTTEGAKESDVQVKDPQTLEPEQGVSPSGPVKKRKKRKSIGQQSMKTKSNKAQTSPKAVLKPQQKRVPKPKAVLPIELSHEELRVEAQVNGLPFGGQKHPTAPEVTESRDFAAEAADLGPEDDREEVNPKSRKRKRVSIGQQSKKRPKPAPAKLPKDIVPEGGIAVAEHMTDASQSQDENAEDVADTANDAIEEQGTALENAEPRNRQKPKRKKRKSIGQQRPKTKSTESASVGSPANKKVPKGKLSGLSKTERAASAFNSSAAGGREPIDEDAQIEVESISEAAEAPAVLPKFPKQRGRPKKDDRPSARKPAKAVKSQQRRQQVPGLAPKPSKAASSRVRGPPQNSIPITIYGPPSPASSDAKLSDVENDPLSSAHALATAKTINPVDVLSQICREMIHKSGNSLTEKAHEDPARRGEFKRKKRTVEMYGEELNARLLQLTKTLNTNNALTTRLCDATREAKSLKKEIKAIEEEREQVEQRKEEALKAKKAKELETMLDGIASAVQKGWEMQAKERGRAGTEVGVED